jgi:predicted transglutaminase-like cysteine proteinase
MNLTADIRRARKAGALALLLALGVSGRAQAVELDYAKLTRINLNVNASYGKLADKQVCGAVAVNKAWQLMQTYPAKDVSIDIVTDEHGLLHAVAEVRGEIKGRPGAYILDSHYPYPVLRADLERAGYRWMQQFSGPSPAN